MRKWISAVPAGVMMAALGLAACGRHGAAASADAPPQPDAGVLPADASPTDAWAELPDAAPCSIGDLPAILPSGIQVTQDFDADVALALPDDFTIEPIADTAAAVFERPGEIFGFWVELDGEKDVTARAHALDTVLGTVAAPDAEVSSYAAGMLATTHDGNQAVVDRESRVAVTNTAYDLQASVLRNAWLAALLGRTVTELGLDAASDALVDSAVARYSVVERPGGTVVVAALADQTTYVDRTSAIGTLVRAIADGTAISSVNWLPSAECESAEATAASRIDLIIDHTNREGPEDVAGMPGYVIYYYRTTELGEALFDELLGSGLDARIGLATPVMSGTPPLCDGRFIPVTEAEHAVFSECLSASPASLLENGMEMIENALPRAEDETHARPDAQLALVLMGADSICFDGGISTGCEYYQSPSLHMQVDLEALEYAFRLNDASASLFTFAHEGVPAPPCPSWFNYNGWENLTSQVGGQAFDQCYEDAMAAADTIIAKSIAAAMPYSLDEQPITSSLVVSSTAGVLGPTPDAGFEYLGITENALRVRGVPVAPGETSTIGVAFDRWVEYTPPD